MDKCTMQGVPPKTTGSVGIFLMITGNERNLAWANGYAVLLCVALSAILIPVHDAMGGGGVGRSFCGSGYSTQAQEGAPHFVKSFVVKRGVVIAN